MLCSGFLTLGLVCKEVVNLGNGSVEGNDIETVIRSVENQVLAHNGQANEAEVTSRTIVSTWSDGVLHRVDDAPRSPANVNARQPGAESSKKEILHRKQRIIRRTAPAGFAAIAMQSCGGSMEWDDVGGGCWEAREVMVG